MLGTVGYLVIVWRMSSIEVILAVVRWGLICSGILMMRVIRGMWGVVLGHSGHVASLVEELRESIRE
jgi:hypothetical protein